MKHKWSVNCSVWSHNISIILNVRWFGAKYFILLLILFNVFSLAWFLEIIKEKKAKHHLLLVTFWGVLGCHCSPVVPISPKQCISRPLYLPGLFVFMSQKYQGPMFSCSFFLPGNSPNFEDLHGLMILELYVFSVPSTLNHIFSP